LENNSKTYRLKKAVIFKTAHTRRVCTLPKSA